MLKDILLQDKYYLEQLTLFLRNSYGIEKEISSYVDILRQIDKVESDIFKALQASVENELALNIEYVNSLNEETSNLMDNIGAIVGAYRELTLSYTTSGLYDSPLSYTNEKIVLNNFDFYVYIVCQIFRNGYNGTFKMARDLYEKLESLGIHIIMFTDQSIAGQCNVYFDDDSSYGYNSNPVVREQNRHNLYALLFSGLLTLSSMGIIYNHSVVSLNYSNEWETALWGVAKWASDELESEE